MGRNKKEPEKKEGITLSVAFHPDVDFDLQNAFDYYEEKRVGLGEEFVLSVEASLNYICRNPYHYQKITSKTRHAIIKRFPFGIFYIIDMDVIYVSAIIHLSRSPKIWKSRK